MNQNRRQILSQLDELHKTECVDCLIWKDRNNEPKMPKQCVSCSTYKEIRSLGESLLQNPRRPKKIRSLLDKGADMEDEDILVLFEQGVKKSVIRKAMNISREEFAIVWDHSTRVVPLKLG